MKFKITFKTPDALENAAENLERKDFDSEDEFEDAKLEIRGFGGEYVKYGEIVTLEFDTDSQTVQVLKW